MTKKLKPGKKSPDTADLEKLKFSDRPFTIRMGAPHMDALWNDLTAKSKTNKLAATEQKLYKKTGKTLQLLAANPFYPSLNSHEIDSLTKKYGKKIFESYLENKTPGAARIFWTYGPGRGEITILALEPHPEPGQYGRVKLDSES